jgi:hypothetical protein
LLSKKNFPVLLLNFLSPRTEEQESTKNRRRDLDINVISKGHGKQTMLTQKLLVYSIFVNGNFEV